MKIYRISETQHAKRERQLRGQGHIGAWRNWAHLCFDKLWKQHGLTRGEAYQGLSQRLGIPASETHMANFSVEQCRETVDWAAQTIEALQQIDKDYGAHQS